MTNAQHSTAWAHHRCQPCSPSSRGWPAWGRRWQRRKAGRTPWCRCRCGSYCGSRAHARLGSARQAATAHADQDMPTWVGCCAVAGVRSSCSPCAFRHGHDRQRGAANSACASNFRGGKCPRCEPPTAQRWSTRATSVTPEDIDPAAVGGALVTGCVRGRSRPACNSGTACATRIRHPAVACGTCSGHV